jgi:hypothetical protein
MKPAPGMTKLDGDPGTQKVRATCGILLPRPVHDEAENREMIG